VRRGEDRGSALVLALALVVLAHAVAGAVAVRVVSSARSEQRRLRHAQAFEAAEAGLAESVQWLLAGEAPDLPETDVGDATAEVRHRPVPDASADQVLELVAVGRCRGAVERLELVVAVTVSPGSGAVRVERLSWRRRPGAEERR
jgi:Tfp pilus assembly protein PilX